MTDPSPTLDRALAERLARIALGHVGREYPNVIAHVLRGDADAKTPRAMHPVFYGSFDWHSCVHGHWLLARLLRAWPDLEAATAIRAHFDAAFTPRAVAGEVAYLSQPLTGGFERPYGWAWLLKLAAELARHDDHGGRRWAASLAPLAELFAERLRAFLPRADYPVRAGVHTNTAFALRLAQDYAEAAADAPLATLIRDKADAWYSGDRSCQAWEPSGDDFLSPALVEAELMRRLLDRADFTAWLDAFLPELARGEPAMLFQPARVSDRSDGKIAHLDGLNLSRAWCWRGLAAALPDEDPRRPLAQAAADRHLAASLDEVAGDYMGEHWLASFALLALLVDEA